MRLGRRASKIDRARRQQQPLRRRRQDSVRSDGSEEEEEVERQRRRRRAIGGGCGETGDGLVQMLLQVRQRRPHGGGGPCRHKELWMRLLVLVLVLLI